MCCKVPLAGSISDCAAQKEARLGVISFTHKLIQNNHAITSQFLQQSSDSPRHSLSTTIYWKEFPVAFSKTTCI
jgi:hypothetical protein